MTNPKEVNTQSSNQQQQIAVSACNTRAIQVINREEQQQQ